MTTTIAAPHPAALAAAQRVLEAGGGAIDAALAAAVTLTVVYPHQCSLGGDLIALVRTPDGRITSVLSVGAAPAGVDVEALTALGAVPSQGALPVTVPGILAGWRALAALGATVPLENHLSAAAALAENGATVSAGLARALLGRESAVRADPGLSGIFVDASGDLLTEGAPLHQPALARTLATLASDPSAYYDGPIGARLAEFLAEGGSAMTAADFAAHETEAAAPVVREIGGGRWSVAPAPSTGPVLLGLLPEAIAADSDPDALANLVTAAHAARAVRAAVLGDPRGGDIDVARLLDPLGSAPGHEPHGVRPLGDTVAVVAADDSGTVVTLIQSAYQSFGSGMLEPQTGIVLHNRGAAFSVAPGHPGRIGPGLRPPHTLLPAIVETDELVLGIGCQGGPSQPWILAQLAPALLHPAADSAAVLARPRWVIGAGDVGLAELSVVLEPGAPAGASVAAESLGLPVSQADGLLDEAGHVQLVRIFADGSLDAATDPRADGNIVLFPPRKEAP